MGLMRQYYTRLYSTSYPARRAKVRRQAKQAEEWIMERIRHSLGTDADFRRWQMSCVYRRWSGCRACRLSTGCGVVSGHGSVEPLLAVVGGWPDSKDTGRNRIFTGQDGAVLRKASAKVGIDLADAWLSPAAACPPRGVKPRQDEVESCRGRLEAELAVVRPKVVLLLGITAVRLLMDVHPEDRISDWRGLVPQRYWPWPGLYWFGPHVKAVFATYHPRSILALPDKRSKARALERFAQDLRKVKRVLDKLIQRREERR